MTSVLLLPSALFLTLRALDVVRKAMQDAKRAVRVMVGHHQKLPSHWSSDVWVGTSTPQLTLWINARVSRLPFDQHIQGDVPL